jgi:hypothetical protein
MMPRVFVAIGLLCAIPHVAAAQTGAAPFCLQTVGGGVRCVFGTMGECERARANPSSSQCITRSDAQGTTGLGERPSGVTGPRIERPPERTYKLE